MEGNCFHFDTRSIHSLDALFVLAVVFRLPRRPSTTAAMSSPGHCMQARAADLAGGLKDLAPAPGHNEPVDQPLNLADFASRAILRRRKDPNISIRERHSTVPVFRKRVWAGLTAFEAFYVALQLANHGLLHRLNAAVEHQPTV